MMKFKDNVPLKEIGERYSRVLGVDRFPRKRQSRWIIWILIPFILALLSHLLFNSKVEKKKSAENTENLSHLSVNQGSLQDTDNPLGSITIPEPYVEVSDLDLTTSKHAERPNTAEKAPIDAPHRNPQSISALDFSTLHKTASQRVEATRFFVIVNSTTSKKDAIKIGKQLREKGYSSEVVLSSSGYYGVALGRFDFDDGKAAMKAALDSGVIKNKPYLMSVDRVSKFIYPEKP